MTTSIDRYNAEWWQITVNDEVVGYARNYSAADGFIVAYLVLMGL